MKIQMKTQQKEYDQEQVEILPLLTALSLEQEGEGDGLFLTASLLAQCLVRGMCTVQTIVDAYTTQGIFEPEWKTIPLAGCLDRQSGMQTLRQVIAEPLGEIVDAEAYPDFPAQRREGGWFLTFRVAPTGGRSAICPFAMTFYDAGGKARETRQMGFSASVDEEEAGQVMLPLPGYQDGEVWLETYYSHVTSEDPPIVISVK